MNSQIIMLLGGSALLYWYLSQQSSSTGSSAPPGAPSDAVPIPSNYTNGKCPSGQYLWFSPSQGLTGWSACGPATSAQLAAGQAALNSAAGQAALNQINLTNPPGGSSTVSSGVTPPAQTTQPGNVPVSQPTTPVAVTVATPPLTGTANAFAAAVSAGQAAGDPSITSAGATPYVLAYYLQNVAAPALSSVSLPLATIFPGVDLTQPMSVSTFWAGMGAYLNANNTYGLSGLGYSRSQFRGAYIRTKGGWAA